MTYRIRAVDASDAHYASEVARLHAALFPKIVFPIPHYGHWWLVYNGKDAVAFSHLCLSDRYPNTGYFARVGVLPEHRGHSLQSKLMERAEKKAIALGWDAIVSDTTKVPHSYANFEKRGWWQFTPEVPWGSAATVYWRIEF